MRLIATLLLLAGCSSEPKPTPPTPPEQATYAVVADRVANFYDTGFVVSLTKDKEPQSRGQGDSLIWTGELVYALDCARGTAPAQALAKMVTSTGGALYRHPSIPNDVSVDGALGFYRGVAKRVVVCGERDYWAPVFAAHLAYVAAHGGHLNAGSSATFIRGLDYVQAKLAAALGLRSEPTADAQAGLESEMAPWAGSVMGSHAACYPLHLSLMALQTIELLGDTISPEARTSYCVATNGSRIPTGDYWCGRGNLPDWLAAFQYDQWEYRHQRCSAWESPDGNGLSQPAVDYLVGWADYHGTPQ
jgi:hypothetical protein